MALHFANSGEWIDHGSGTSLDDLDAQTWIFWTNPASGTNSNRRIVRKGTNLQVYVPYDNTHTFSIRYYRVRATTDTDVTSPAAFFTTGAWKFVAIVDDDGVTPRIYGGDLSTAVAEVGSYFTQTTGSGAPTSDAADVLTIGSRNTASTNSDHRIAYVWVYNRVLSLGEIRLHQFFPHAILSGCVLKTAYFDTTYLMDLSGNGNNGTINGTPDFYKHVPLAPPFGYGLGQTPEIAVPVAGESSYMAYIDLGAAFF